jgi:hypothetical protein
MRKLLYWVILLGLFGAVGYWLFLRSRTGPVREQAVISERKATAWNRLATVREPAASLRFGERVGVIESRGWSGADYVLVRTKDGSTGWVEARHLMSAALWARATANVEQSKRMSVQACGKTKVLTNVRVDPGRSAPRTFQFGRDVFVDILSRAVVELPPEESAAKESKEQPAEQPQGPRREDWLFVRARDPDAGDIAGWVLGRFIELDLPAPLRDYAAGIRFVAWFELDRVPAMPSTEERKTREEGGEPSKPEAMPQYLAAGVIGAEGQPCDFTLLRFYTWNPVRRRYETAFIESNFCARLPIQVTPIPPGANLDKAEASFTFVADVPSRRGTSAMPAEERREYRMRQNIIRRLRPRK